MKSCLKFETLDDQILKAADDGRNKMQTGRVLSFLWDQSEMLRCRFQATAQQISLVIDGCRCTISDWRSGEMQGLLVTQ
jgi:hypothetical protein